MQKLHIIQKMMLKKWSKYTKEFINWMSWMTTFNIELISRHLKINNLLKSTKKSIFNDDEPNFGTNMSEFI